eukprot:2177654-Rhodomonas_salina.1
MDEIGRGGRVEGRERAEAVSRVPLRYLVCLERFPPAAQIFYNWLRKHRKTSYFQPSGTFSLRLHSLAPFALARREIDVTLLSDAVDPDVRIQVSPGIEEASRCSARATTTWTAHARTAVCEGIITTRMRGFLGMSQA